MTRSMAKKARKNVKKSAFRSSSLTEDGPAKFPLHSLPAELIHMIFDYLTPTEIASMRLMSSTIAAIGLKYIAITVILTLQEDSFDRLLDIARHPVVSKSVRNLCYKHGSLSSLPRTEWEHRIITPKLAAAQRESIWSLLPSDNISKRGLRAFYRELNSANAYNTYGKKRLDQAFSTYQKHCVEEDRARQSDFFFDKLVSALHLFPNLETIYMLSGSCHRYCAEISKTLKRASYYQPTINVDNVAVTYSVLAAVDRVVRDSQIMNGGATNVEKGPALIARSRGSSATSGNDLVMNYQVKTGPGDGTSNRYCPMPGRSQSLVRIKHLVLEDFDWRVLLEGVQVFSAIKRSLSHLTKLEVHLLGGRHNRSSDVDDLLHQFVKLAPGLEELRVSLHRHPSPLRFVGLPDIIGSFHWTSLKTVHFSKILIEAENLQEFCSRHSSTLSKFSLGKVFMGEHALVAGRDAWHSMFTKIRETTKLEKARVYGCLSIVRDEYYMNDRADVRRTSGTLIARYLVGEGGGSSLKDFMRDERRGIPRQRGDSSDEEDA